MACKFSLFISLKQGADLRMQASSSPKSGNKYSISHSYSWWLINSLLRNLGQGADLRMQASSNPESKNTAINYSQP